MSANTAIHNVTRPSGASTRNVPLIGQREGDVLGHDAPRAPRQPHEAGDAGQVVAHQSHVGSLEGGVAAGGAHGDAHVGGGQGGGVVDAVTDHGRGAEALAEVAHGVDLVLRQQAGAHLVDADLPTDGLGRRLVVTGEHDDVLDALRPHRPQGLAGAGAYRVRDGDHA